MDGSSSKNAAKKLHHRLVDGGAPSLLYCRKIAHREQSQEKSANRSVGGNAQTGRSADLTGRAGGKGRESGEVKRGGRLAKT